MGKSISAIRRKDKAERPPGRKVDFQGHGTNDIKGWMVLEELIVNGTLKAKSAKTPMRITTTGPITVGAGGKIGGKSSGSGGSQNKLPIFLVSTKDSDFLGNELSLGKKDISFVVDRGTKRLSGADKDFAFIQKINNRCVRSLDKADRK